MRRARICPWIRKAGTRENMDWAAGDKRKALKGRLPKSESSCLDMKWDFVSTLLEHTVGIWTVYVDRQYRYLVPSPA